MFAPAFSSQRNANAYRRVGVETGVDAASPHQLVTMLFDGFSEAVAKARSAMAQGRIEEKCRAITHAVRIVDEGLKAPLDVQAGGELARNLKDLYAYVTVRLTQANLHNDPAALDECVRLLEPVRTAWQAIGPAASADVQ